MRHFVRCVPLQLQVWMAINGPQIQRPLNPVAAAKPGAIRSMLMAHTPPALAQAQQPVRALAQPMYSKQPQHSLHRSRAGTPQNIVLKPDAAETPPPGLHLSTDVNVPSLAARLAEFYARHAPDKVQFAAQIAAHPTYAGDEELLQRSLRDKYGEDCSVSPQRQERPPPTTAPSAAHRSPPVALSPPPPMSAHVHAPAPVSKEYLGPAKGALHDAADAARAGAPHVAADSNTHHKEPAAQGLHALGIPRGAASGTAQTQEGSHRTYGANEVKDLVKALRAQQGKGAASEALRRPSSAGAQQQPQERPLQNGGIGHTSHVIGHGVHDAASGAAHDAVEAGRGGAARAIPYSDMDAAHAEAIDRHMGAHPYVSGNGRDSRAAAEMEAFARESQAHRPGPRRSALV